MSATTRFSVPTDWSERWPCSTLAGCRVSMGEDANGDLVELTVTYDGKPVDTTDLDAAELEAAREQYVYVAEARSLGEAAGKAAASWVTDGNSDVAERGRVLAMMRAGDPAADDYLPRRPDLSGEFAGDPTPQSLFRDITGRDATTDADSDLMGRLADAWENGVADVFAPECERLLLTEVAE